jgi:hypothetical protein
MGKMEKTTKKSTVTQSKAKVSKKNITAKSKINTKSRTSKTRAKRYEPDSAFFLKAVIFLILGSQWVYIQSGESWQLPIPVGLIIGLVFVTHEHFKIDRKIEYVILLFAAFIAFWLPLGLVVQV